MVDRTSALAKSIAEQATPFWQASIGRHFVYGPQISPDTPPAEPRELDTVVLQHLRAPQENGAR